MTSSNLSNEAVAEMAARIEKLELENAALKAGKVDAVPCPETDGPLAGLYVANVQYKSIYEKGAKKATSKPMAVGIQVSYYRDLVNGRASKTCKHVFYFDNKAFPLVDLSNPLISKCFSDADYKLLITGPKKPEDNATAFAHFSSRADEATSQTISLSKGSVASMAAAEQEGAGEVDGPSTSAEPTSSSA